MGLEIGSRGGYPVQSITFVEDLLTAIKREDMISKLIYNPLNTKKSYESVFYKEFRALSLDKETKLAFPYINLDLLKRLTGVTQNWLLIADVGAWLQSNDRKSQEAIIEFLKTHICQVHDIPNLHAKVILNDVQAIIGSANLTSSGMKTNHELSVKLTDIQVVDELHLWFDELWKQSESPSIHKLEQLLEKMEPVQRVKFPKGYQPESIELNAYVRTDGAITDIREAIELILRRALIPYGQITLYKALFFSKEGLTFPELADKIRNNDSESLRGVMGALGNRINQTKGVHPNLLIGTNLFLIKNRRKKSVIYSLRPELREAIENMPNLVALFTNSNEEIRQVFNGRWRSFVGRQSADLQIHSEHDMLQRLSRLNSDLKLYEDSGTKGTMVRVNGKNGKAIYLIENNNNTIKLQARSLKLQDLLGHEEEFAGRLRKLIKTPINWDGYPPIELAQFKNPFTFMEFEEVIQAILSKL